MWIEEDLTFRERKMRWNLRRIADEERRKERLVKLGIGRLWIDNVWWFWNNVDETLKDERGRKWEEGEKERKEKGEVRVDA